MLVDAPSQNITEEDVGKRIECSGYYGTIKYVGPVAGHPSLWLGIDWDDPQRGKHDGSVNGVQYFTTRHLKSGSFVRPEKVNFGQTIIHAITSRYGQVDDEVTAKLNHQTLLSIQQSFNAPFLQLVGFDGITEKQGDYNSLQIANVRLQNVSSLGEALEVKGLCPNLRELDISKNLLTSWTQIYEICLQLEHLEILNVNENVLEKPNVVSMTFPNIKMLCCGQMDLTWSDILKLTAVFPNLGELRAHQNNITTIEVPEDNYMGNINLIDLDSNPIENWQEICKLGTLPNLNELLVVDVGIKKIWFPKKDKITLFSSLRKLVLCDNKIDNWESIGELNKLQNLEDLRFLKNPILETETYNTCVQLIITRIASLKYFNGSEIETGERKGAEYDYIKKYGLEWLSVRGTENQGEFLEKHNRYLELIEKYGTPDESELKVIPKVISGTLINIELSYEGRSIKKKLPPSLDIQKLIMMSQKLFRLENRPTLLYVSGNQPDIEILLDDEGKELGFYSIQEGDKIIVRP